jgi:hypothetical protein
MSRFLLVRQLVFKNNKKLKAEYRGGRMAEDGEKIG